MPGGVDPTGYVKGWAAEQALAALVEGGATRAIVNAAGDVATYGSSLSSAPYRIGIVDPNDSRHLACVVEVSGAIATSGTYERGEHLFDPHTSVPCSRVGSASVVGPDLGLADALATALAVAGEQGLAMVDAIAGYEALTIAWNGTWKSTRAFPFSSDTGPHPVDSRQTA
jgi:thiamine biosynthesis lipoprotein